MRRKALVAMVSLLMAGPGLHGLCEVDQGSAHEALAPMAGAAPAADGGCSGLRQPEPPAPRDVQPPPIGIPELDGLELDVRFTGHPATDADVAMMMGRLGVREPGADHGAMAGGRGLARPTMEEYASMVGNVTIIDGVRASPAALVPTKVDLSSSPYFPAVGDQGWLGACAPWALSYYANGFLQARDHNWTDAHLGTNTSQLMGPSWVYNLLNGGRNAGASSYSILLLISSLGNARWSTHPYINGDYLSWGNEAAWRDAPEFRAADQWEMLDTSMIGAIKAKLAQGNVVTVELCSEDIFDGLGWGDAVISASEQQMVDIDHGIAMVGFDDSVVADGEVGAFKCVNSWGDEWGSEWGGHGFFCITYDAVRELESYAYCLRDLVGYRPTLLATITQMDPGPTSAALLLGVEGDPFLFKYTPWAGSQNRLPAFLAIDATEFEDYVGLAPFYLTAPDSWPSLCNITSFEMEWYKDGDRTAPPTAVAASRSVPALAPCTVNASFDGVHVEATSPLEGTWQRQSVNVSGRASANVSRCVFQDDFEQQELLWWGSADMESASGLDSWGMTDLRSRSGRWAVWAAGLDQGTAFEDGFDSQLPLALTWTTRSDGPERRPFSTVNSGYPGCSLFDYVAVSDSGGGARVTEWMTTAKPIGAYNLEGLRLRFYIDIRTGDGDEYGRVMWSNGSSYPSFKQLDEFRVETVGYLDYDLSFLDGEEEVYLAFVYHGTGDRYMALDDIELVGEKSIYDDDMRARLSTNPGNLTSFDRAVLNFSYWLRSEEGHDGLRVIYYSRATFKWSVLWERSGLEGEWRTVELDVPLDVATLSFEFYSDGAVGHEGAFIDDVSLTALLDLDGVRLQVDGGPWHHLGASTAWSDAWDTRSAAPGAHAISVRADYGKWSSEDRLALYVDNALPELVADDLPARSTTGSALLPSVSARDNVGLSAVGLLWYYGDDPSGAQNATLGPTDVDPGGNGTYSGRLAVDPRTPGDLHVAFTATDLAGNVNLTGWYVIAVVDDDKPWFGDELTQQEVTTGDPWTVTIVVFDNIGVEQAWALCRYDGDFEENASLLRGEGDNWTAALGVPYDARDLSYAITARDSSGNLNSTRPRDLRVVDNDPPVLLADLSSATATTGDPLTFRVTAWDNLGTVGARVTYWYNGGERARVLMRDVSDVMEGSRAFLLETEVPSDSTEPLHYLLELEDSAGNLNSTAERTVEVVDDDPPTIAHAGLGSPSIKGLDAELDATVRDNIGVAGVMVTYRFGEGPEESLPMGPATSGGGTDFRALLHIPRIVEGQLRYMLTAMDASGNLVATEWFEVACVNRPPELRDDLPPWDVTEGAPSSLDLAGWLIDANDAIASLRLSCDAAFIDVVGSVLTALYDSWAPHHAVQVRVTDGEDTLWLNITVRVANVNDAPVIASVLPANGSRYREGGTVHLLAEATDEDGDLLLYAWREGDRVLGSGESLDLRGLTPGAHVITLEVSDGKGTATWTVTLVVRAEDGTPTALAVLTVVVAAAACALAYAYVRRRTKV